MRSEAQLLESNALRNLQQVSEARGMKFYINPSRELVPSFLGDIQPDAIAIGPEGGIIIEVKLRGSPASEKQLAAIARKVSGQKGWEFRAIVLNPPTDGTPSIAKPTPEQLQVTFEEIEALTKGGHPAAALVTGWAALGIACSAGECWQRSAEVRRFLADSGDPDAGRRGLYRKRGCRPPACDGEASHCSGPWRLVDRCAGRAG
ncbi:MAG: hypothetical protein QOH05_1448 [Acetobacteraceae bacterium]|nr:hypothetical protein [Acetobacteraceae bacterium]